MKLNLHNIAKIVGGKCLGKSVEITDIVYDSRSCISGKPTLFVALQNGNRDGHSFIDAAIEGGCMALLIQEDYVPTKPIALPIITVPDTLLAYQQIAAYLRAAADIPVIGITGSNGKTILKEWLYQALSPDFQIIKTPKSYNSQIGVPQSVMPIDDSYDIGLFEAGISQVGEMARLKSVIQPTIGVFTNIGDAHQEHFTSITEKIQEKLLLFSDVETLIYCRDHELIHAAIDNTSALGDTVLFSWGLNTESTVLVKDLSQSESTTTMTLLYKDATYNFSLPKLSSVELENTLHLITCLLYFGYPQEQIQARILQLSTLPHRLQVLQGKHGNTLINDSYTSDFYAFKYALDYMQSHYPDQAKVVITSLPNEVDVFENLLTDYGVFACLYIGKSSSKTRFTVFETTEKCIAYLDENPLSNHVVLLKGHRVDHLEELSNFLALQTHTTTLQIQLNAIAHNLNTFTKLLEPSTKVIAVIKASAYGSGSGEIGLYLSKLRVDYLAVALLDEGIELRRKGITKPIMLFNFFDLQNLSLLWKYRLEPEVYSFEQLESLIYESKNQDTILNIHLKLESGMHRLGFVESELDQLASMLDTAEYIHAESIFSHLAASDNPIYDDFTAQQVERYLTAYAKLTASLNYRPMRHILNTSGIVRHTAHQLDAIRIGLGLYGIDDSKMLCQNLQKVHTFSTRVLQVKTVEKGGSISYNRSRVVDSKTTIAILGAGYADGIPRSAFKGGYSFYFNSKLLPLVGTVCMDVCMVDVSACPEIKPGDTVEVFGKNQKIEDLAKATDTIAYEILSQIAPRVKRIYIED